MPEPEKMLALSLWQPWASLIALGEKRIETRSWPTDYRGPVAIHAAKKFDKGQRELCEAQPFAACLSHADALPLGAVVAVARLVDCVPAERARPGLHERAFGHYAPGRFAWLLADVRRLPEPVPCAGARKLFALPDDVAAAVRAVTGAPASEPPDYQTTLQGDPMTAEPVTNDRAAAEREAPPPAVPDAAAWAEITEARHAERDAEQAVADLKRSLKAANDRHEQASEYLGALLDDWRSGQRGLFAGKPADGAKTGESIPNPIPPEHSKPDGAWRSIGTHELVAHGLKPAASDRLIEAGLETIGAVEDWRAGDCQTPKVKGFASSGTATRKALDDAVVGFWAAHPQQKPAQPAGKAAPGDADAPGGSEAGPANGKAADGPWPPDHVGLSWGEVASRAHMHLLTKMQTGGVYPLRSVVEHDGATYVVTPAPAGNEDDVYALRLLWPDGAFPAAADPADPYWGGRVLWERKSYQIGPVEDVILIRDPQEAPAAAAEKVSA